LELQRDQSRSVLPETMRPWIRTAVALLVVVAIVAIVWRGPAILLDLSALAAWCF